MTVEAKKKLAAVAKKWRTAKAPAKRTLKHFGDKDIDSGKHVAQVTGASVDDATMVVKWELKIIAGNDTGKRPADVTCNLLYEPEDDEKADGVDIFKGHCETFELNMPSLTLANIKKGLKSCVGKAVEIYVGYREGSKGILFQNVFFNHLVKDTSGLDSSVDLSDNPPPDGEEDEEVEVEEVEEAEEQESPPEKKAKKSSDDEEWEDEIDWDEE